MNFSLRNFGTALVVLTLALCWSCEQHHVGELPAEREPVHANQPNPTPATSSAGSVSPTPVEFFPQSSPR